MPIPVRPREGASAPIPLRDLLSSEPVDTFTEPVDTPDVSADDDGPGIGAYAIGGLAGLLALLAARNPGRAGQVAKKVSGAVNEARFGSMLSGLAVPKSVMGNIGAAAVSSAERRSLAPLKEFFSPETVKDYVSALRGRQALGQTAGGTAQSGVTQGSSILNLPGRLIGAGDVATKNALVRAGLTDKEAAIQLLQRPLPRQIAKKLDNPAARFLFPFRTVPYNTFMEGMDRLNVFTPANPHRLVSAAAIGGGALTGAATDDPRTVAITAPLAGTYAVPYIVGGMLGKYLSGDGEVGPAKQVASGVSPYSDYAIGTLLDPLRPYTKPAALTALDYLFGGE